MAWQYPLVGKDHAKTRRKGTGMWALLSRRLRLWFLLAVGVPIVGWFLEALANRMEARGGETALTRRMHSGRSWLREHERGLGFRRRRNG
jgi:predicted alpha/beta hydrolase